MFKNYNYEKIRWEDLLIYSIKNNLVIRTIPEFDELGDVYSHIVLIDSKQYLHGYIRNGRLISDSGIEIEY